MAAHSRILPGESPGQRRLAGYSAKGQKELDETEPAGTQVVLTSFPRKGPAGHRGRSVLWTRPNAGLLV